MEKISTLIHRCRLPIILGMQAGGLDYLKVGNSGGSQGCRSSCLGGSRSPPWRRIEFQARALASFCLRLRREKMVPFDSCRSCTEAKEVECMQERRDAAERRQKICASLNSAVSRSVRRLPRLPISALPHRPSSICHPRLALTDVHLPQRPSSFLDTPGARLMRRPL